MKCECKECVIQSLMFSNVGVAEIENICYIKTEKEFKKGEIIYNKGDEISDFAYLKSGLVKYYSIFNDGKSHILSIAKPFDTINMINSFNECKSLYNLSALEDSVICYIPLKDIKTIIKTNGNFAFDFIQKFSIVTNKTIKQLMLINSKNLSGRVAFILLHFANDIYKNQVFDIPISRKEIAELIGMTTENVIRALSEFRLEKIIRINGKEIEIIDMDRLTKISTYG
ncbi:MAG: Crp/Fnr family transcriptional regulator [Paludibacter sp.]|nr:Crp/Fnr family transcriptional regulator [Paludibacter sp.]